jgi:hypothetical protein
MKLTPVEGLLHHSRRVLLAEVTHVHLATELHAAKGHFAHDESGISQFPVLHLSPFIMFNHFGWPLMSFFRVPSEFSQSPALAQKIPAWS